MPIGRFIAGISDLIYAPSTGKYLLLRRAGSKDFGAGAWECVTGRVDQGEGFGDAARREMQEELGVSGTVDFILGTSHFYRGAPVPENELVAVLFHCTIEDPGAIEISDEHDALRWVTAVEAHDFLPDHHWLLPLIDQAELMRQTIPAETLRGLGKRIV